MPSSGRRVRATLVHNPEAGDRQSAAALVANLERAGYHITYRSKKAEDLADALRSGESELVIVAGGDGTVAKVAAALAGTRTPLAILPVGTANNIARSLGLVGGSSHIIAGLPTAARKRLDVGLARGPWGERPFVEAAGVGLFARVVALLNSQDGQHLAEVVKDEPGFESALRLLRHLITDYEPRYWQLTLDDGDFSGRYAMVEAMNIRLIGPHLHLAPDADPGDGLFDLVLVAEDQLNDLAAYVAHRLEREATLPNLVAHRGKRLELALREPEVHFDDSSWPGDDMNPGSNAIDPPSTPTVVFEVGERWVDVLVPGP